MPTLTHLAIQVRNLAKSISFYRDFCGMKIVHDRGQAAKRVVWMAEPGKEQTFIMVFMEGNGKPPQDAHDYSHLGFALQSKALVDGIARRAELEDCLAWPPIQEAYPVGYYCGLRDPDGAFVEFSYGQPLGPGAQFIEAN
jgi:catechol 2,3-dioxygenase-like lactoylglutathione lyase family enzyme